MRILFILLWGLILILPQISFRLYIFDLPLGFGLLTLLVIYVGFVFPFVRGLLAVMLLSFVGETFSQVTHGYFILTYAILYIGIQLLADRIYTEAYLTKSLWVLLFSLISQCLTAFVLEPRGLFFERGIFWLQALLQSFIDCIISFPLFILLDLTLIRWFALFSRRRSNLTGVDLYEAQSKQRKFF